MEKDKPHHDEFSKDDIDKSEEDEFDGEITKKDLKRAEELDIYAEDNECLDEYHDLDDDEYIKKTTPRTDFPKAPPMDELFDESDEKPDYDDEYEK